jgi:hypothetical protein
VSGVNGRNTALVVTFELASMSDDDADTLKELIRLAGSDARISDVTHDADEQLLSVALWPNARTQDDREPFGLADAYNVLAESHPADTEGDGATS